MEGKKQKECGLYADGWPSWARLACEFPWSQLLCKLYTPDPTPGLLHVSWSTIWHIIICWINFSEHVSVAIAQRLQHCVVLMTFFASLMEEVLYFLCSKILVLHLIQLTTACSCRAFQMKQVSQVLLINSSNHSVKRDSNMSWSIKYLLFVLNWLVVCQKGLFSVQFSVHCTAGDDHWKIWHWPPAVCR